jgi:hypothetical protein
MIHQQTLMLKQISRNKNNNLIYPHHLVMRFALFSLLLLYSVSAYSQTVIQVIVRDSKTNEALPYCNISVKGTKKGTITNDDGAFRIYSNLIMDTLVFSYVGYKGLEIPSLRLYHEKFVLLERKDVLLQEFTVHASDEFLYKILEQCRKKIIKNQASCTSKVYYGIETQSRGKPVEILECYYNGYLNGTAIEKLLLKNGRIGLSGLDQRYFLTLNSSKAISQVNLAIKNKNWPSIPLQFNLKDLKKIFRLSLGTGDNEMYYIEFYPWKDTNQHFHGGLWIDKKTFSLIKIDLSIENAARHPFQPLFSFDSLSHVGLNISHSYKDEGSCNVLDHINFSYSATYKSVRDSSTVKIPSIVSREIVTKGVMYFYDYGSPFILPYFEYDADYDDYRKMSVIPYNEVFWNNNNPFILTEEQKESLGFFSQDGYLVNYRQGNYGKNFLQSTDYHSIFYESNYTFWDPEKRIMLNKKLQQNSTYSQEKINNSILNNLYSLKVQVLLDITQVGNTFSCKSYTVFDPNKTFYHLPEQPQTNSFLNIYFDICEIERRKMENVLNSSSFTIEQIDSIYKGVRKSIDNLTRQYLKEVKLGQNEKSLSKWNDYILKNLGIDNKKIFPSENNK